jgi:hypothetical protein
MNLSLLRLNFFNKIGKTQREKKLFLDQFTCKQTCTTVIALEKIGFGLE